MHQSGTRTPLRMAAVLMSAGALLLGGAVQPAAAVDSIRAEQWYLDAMKAPEMWKISTGRGITVAVIDSGFKTDHPDLGPNILPGKDFSGLPGGVSTDSEGHGTGMAQIIAGSGKGLGGKGAYGLAPGAMILPIRVNLVDTSHSEKNAEILGQLSRAIRYAADSDAKVINMSLGLRSKSAALQAAVDYARSRGKLLVASAGNSGDSGNAVEYPSSLPGVVAVSAVGRDGEVTAESEHGPQVALAAPGEDIYRACTRPSGYCKAHGTSDAAALVSASAALVWSEHPDWTANQVLRVLINTAGKDGEGRSDYLGYGVVRPRVALTDPGDPGPADVYPLAAAAPSAGASAPAGSPSAGGASQPPGDAASPAPSSAAPAAESGGGSGAGLWIGVGAAVLAVAAVVVLLLVRRGRGGGSGPSSGGPGGPGGGYGQPYPGPQAPPYPAPSSPTAPPHPGPYPNRYQAPPAGGFGPPQGGPYGGGTTPPQ
ncbi:type VII secretion-associated serine protease mycosin [Streptomyces sp. NPDC001380]|uniref:type VII secretion-associated serine protease mycosin n=1 Tax=Streptomyces sp. NPDC001380 TaxID=3364566 RepID=UPI0036C2D449